ncbi:MAG: choice-of-anchor D domain-containing protein, partial [Akkermansiaceae bacterium]|nr:choice-of-anchor D domain-containing protein [Akkermansiaceae bacterium]
GSKVSFEISDDPTFAFVPSTSTISGTGSEGYVDGPREAAEFGFVSGVAQDLDGNLFIADTGNHRIRMMTPGGVVSTIAGNGEGINSFGLVNGPGTVAKFAFPAGVAVGPDQNVYVSDTINHCIRKITRPEIEGQPWTVTTLAGSGAEGYRDGSGLNAQFDHPHGLTLDGDGNVYVADADNHVVRLVEPDGTVSTYAGSGTPGVIDPILTDCETTDASTQLTCGSTADLRAGMRVSGVNIAEGTSIVGIIDATTVLLSDPATGTGTALTLSFSGGTKLTAQFNEPFGLVFNDIEDLLFVVNRGNHIISEIAVGPEGLVRTLAGRLQGFGDGTGAAAQFHGPSAVAIDVQNNLFVSDEFNHAIRKVNTFTGEVTTVDGSTTQVTGFVDGDPTESLFNCPAGLVYGKEGSLIVADTLNHALRRVLVDPVLVLAELGPDIGGVTEVSAEFTVASYGFAPDTTYYFRWVSRVPPVTPESTQRSGQSFHLFDAPVLATEEASLVTATSAQFNAVVDPRNSTTHLVYEYADNPEMTGAQQLIVTVDAASGPGTSIGVPVPQPATPGETVYFRAVATNGRGTVSGEIFGFTFPIATVATTDASDITTTTAQLNGEVNAEGSPLEVQFEYSTEADLGAPWQVSTRAGNGNVGFEDTASPLDAEFNQPQEVAVSGGDVFIADRLNHVIRKIASDGVVSTLAGTNQGFAEGTGLDAQFDRPAGIAADGVGNLYVADEFNHRIRKINTATGEVTSLAGSSTAGLADGSGAAAEFHFPTGVAVDAAGNVYVSDTANHSIRKITPAGEVTTLAGSGTPGFGDGAGAVAKFSSPRGLAVNDDGDVFVADTGNNRIRKVTAAGEVSTLSGSGTEGFQNGAGGTAQFSSPTGVAVVGSDVYVADYGNHVIRRISEDGETITSAGTGEQGLFDSPSGTLYPATAAQFDAPFGIAADGAGSLWLTEEGNNDLRQIYRIAKPVVEIATPFAGTTAEAADVVIGNLLAGTTYYFRAVGENAIGEIPGEILSFTTLRNQEIEIYAGATTDFPQLVSDQSEVVEFGTTALGTSVAREFTIVNIGEVPLGVAGLRVPSGYSSTAGAASVAPGDSLTIQVSLDATVGGDYNGDMIVDSDDFIFPAFTFPISGVVLDPPSVVTSEATYNPLPVMNGVVNPEGSTTTVGFEYSTTAGLDGLEVTTLAGVDQPNGMAVDAAGNIFIADTANNQIRKVTPSGEVSVFAGNGTAGYLDGAPGAARFNAPVGIVMNSAGTFFVTDSGNHRIRAISPEGQVSTYAGFGEADFTDGVGTAARFDSPSGIAIDSSDVLYIADLNNHRVRKVATDMTVSTLAGSGIGGDLDSPVGIAVGSDGTTYVTEDSSHHVLQISTGAVVAVLAGDEAASGYQDGAAAAARFDSPSGLVAGSNDDLFVADRGNNRIRRINLTDGTVSTFAGSGSSITLDGAGDEAGIAAPDSLALSGNGDLFVGQVSDSTVRQISSATVLIELAGTLDGTADLPVSHELSGLNLERTYYYRVFATSTGGTSFGAVQSFGAAPVSGFSSWQVDQFGADASDPLIAGPNADASGDGVSNLLKYAFFLDPNVSSQAGLPVVSSNGGEVTVTFTKFIAATDLVYT